MSDITPLMARGEGRTIGRIGGLWGELMAEFLGTFVILAFGDGVVAMTVAALPGSGRTGDADHESRGRRRLAADRVRVGVGRRVRHMGGGRRQRGAPQPRRHAGFRRPAQVPLAEGRAVLGRPGGRAPSSALPWCSGCTTPRSRRTTSRRIRRRARDKRWALLLNLCHVPGPVLPRRDRGAADRPDRRHGVPGDARGGRHRRQEHGGRLEHGTADHRLHRGGDRGLVRRERGIRHQPGP